MATHTDALLHRVRNLAEAIIQDDGESVTARHLASVFYLLDVHLSGGGAPPEVWREGPDAPSDDPYCAEHGRRFDPDTGCPECVGT